MTTLTDLEALDKDALLEIIKQQSSQLRDIQETTLKKDSHPEMRQSKPIDIKPKEVNTKVPDIIVSPTSGGSIMKHRASVSTLAETKAEHVHWEPEVKPHSGQEEEPKHLAETSDTKKPKRTRPDSVRALRGADHSTTAASARPKSSSHSSKSTKTQAGHLADSGGSGHNKHSTPSSKTESTSNNTADSHSSGAHKKLKSKKSSDNMTNTSGTNAHPATNNVGQSSAAASTNNTSASNSGHPTTKHESNKHKKEKHVTKRRHARKSAKSHSITEVGAEDAEQDPSTEASEEKNAPKNVKVLQTANRLAILLRSKNMRMAYKFYTKCMEKSEARRLGEEEEGEALTHANNRKDSKQDDIRIILDKDLKTTDIDLDEYLRSLYLEEGNMEAYEAASKAAPALEPGYNWRNEVGMADMGLASAWGRRIFDPDEIDLCDEEEIASKLFSKKDEYEVEEVIKEFLTGDKEKLKDLGIWDNVYDKNALDAFSREKNVKPWEINASYLEKELKKLGFKKEDLQLNKKPVILDPVNNPLDKVKAKYMDTGSYLRPHDILFCLEKTKFPEEKIISWFQRFRLECPDGRLSRTHLRELFQKVFPDGNSSKITGHIFRIFDSDGNDFLDFKEFLMAIDIANRDTDEDKLKWAFKLYDMDGNGVIDIKEMSSIIETLDCIEGVKPGVIRYDENGNPEPVADTMSRAKDIFAAIDRDCDGSLTEEEFIEAYNKRSEILKRQDAMEQKKKLFCLILTGPIIQKNNDFSEERMFDLCTSVISSRAGVEVDLDDLAHVELKSVSSPDSVFTKSIFVRFHNLDLRMKVWASKSFAERNKLFMEEWLTDFRSKLLKKCQKLMNDEFIVNVKTKEGDLIVFYNDKDDGMLKKMTVVTQEQYDDLLKKVGKSETFDPSKDGLPNKNKPAKQSIDDVAEEDIPE